MRKTPSCLLKTAFPIPLVRPLCQKPPSPITAMDRLSALTLKADVDAGPSPKPIVVAPMLNGGRIEKRWQPKRDAGRVLLRQASWQQRSVVRGSRCRALAAAQGPPL